MFTAEPLTFQELEKKLSMTLHLDQNQFNTLYVVSTLQTNIMDFYPPAKFIYPVMTNTYILAFMKYTFFTLVFSYYDH